jgi:hypothetical protein
MAKRAMEHINAGIDDPDDDARSFPARYVGGADADRPCLMSIT